MKNLNPAAFGILVMLFVALALHPGFSQLTFSTISDGQWEDPAIWSLNGTDPCLCIPASNIDGFDVLISHDVATSSNIHVKTGSVLTVAVTGLFDISDKELNIQGGSFISDGFSHIGQFVVGNDGYVQITAPVTIETKFLVLGTIDIQLDEYDTLKVMAADVHINPGATLNAEKACIAVYGGDFDNNGSAYFDNASLCVVGGDIVNKGMLSFSSNTCMTNLDGDFVNKGTVTGTGAVNMTNGMIDNASDDWSGDVDWCATGESEGMPMAEDCNTVDSICALTGQDIPLGLEGIHLDLQKTSRGVNVLWTVNREYNVHCYEVQRAKSDLNFTRIATVLCDPMESFEKQYSFEDRSPFHGAAWYRIAVINMNGSVSYSPISGFNAGEPGPAALYVFPNPLSQQELFVGITGIEETVAGILALYDPQGRLIEKQRVQISPGEVTTLNPGTVAEGYYIIRFRSDNLQFSEVVSVTTPGALN